MWNFLSSLVSWIPSLIKAISGNKKLDSAVDRVGKLNKIQITKEDNGKWLAKRTEVKK